ncbi:hypothetical protein LWP59_20045 [Amycolatopsis acidiphila]|uniref:Uncharacterized protein n=1 Tax=Amycolatopsis acidiphila TaxID=715473 RepID=A0A558AG71_9PSEU|nr:hypothetical protein [Amycolatopsis acidiphila]TVT23267.1 hypothetical protein FNH06_10245 [Amycolatopsis acidiphila]UIJ56486.1 hypothetical protein LWP59_20045 [Amycolatopsis acidiphila]GHG66994.1 hypothetical protein GCM10017788_25550 [Amycolatopsis acidiphila]
MNEQKDHHGWAPDVGGGGEEAQEGRRKAMESPSGERGSGREVSDAEREGVGSTDIEPGSPYGAGESDTARPEEQADSSGTEGRKGPAQRPYGRTDDEDTGVGKEGTATEGSPNLPTGDQGG